MVRVGEEESYVVADIPGLIEDAHKGHGLGIRFLRHIERTRLLVHLIDSSDLLESHPERDYQIVMQELAAFNAALATRPMVLVASKVDLASEGRRLRALEELASSEHLPLFPVSAATGKGIDEFMWGIAQRLRELRATVPPTEAPSASEAPVHCPPASESA